jgi:hypothetical protein
VRPDLRRSILEQDLPGEDEAKPGEEEGRGEAVDFQPSRHHDQRYIDTILRTARRRSCYQGGTAGSRPEA